MGICIHLSHEKNAAMKKKATPTHAFPIGSMVEVIRTERHDPAAGLRFFVHTHDAPREEDGKPMYTLTIRYELIGQQVYNKRPQGKPSSQDMYHHGVGHGACETCFVENMLELVESAESVRARMFGPSEKE
jgi:hypothetical protein